MKAIDSVAIGRWLFKKLDREPTPITEPATDYEDDKLNTVTAPIMLHEDHTQMIIVTQKGHRFLINITEI